jgi:hypothetical protein
MDQRGRPSRHLVLLGNKASGKSFLAASAGVPRIESADLLLWSAVHGRPRTVDDDWLARVAEVRTNISFDEVRSKLRAYIGEQGATRIGELQRDVLNSMPEPAVLVGARYYATVRVLADGGFPLVFVEPDPAEQVRRLAAIILRPEVEAGRLLAEEHTTCEIEACRNACDIIVANRYDTRSALLGVRTIHGLLEVGRVGT